ncbi:MAG: endonuclease domain-containing protein [Alphaproteobacteria bacterium]
MSVERARNLRRNQTDAEKRLWCFLRNRQLAGFKFNRQVPVGPYVADFICRTEKLIIEIDGGQHAFQKQADAKRTKYLAAKGYRVIRFWNNDVLKNTEGVLETIRSELMNSPPHPDPLPRGERE